MSTEKTKTHDITIHASVSTRVTLTEGETIDTLQDRFVDIYLHDHGEDGYRDKADLGCDSSVIIVDDSEKLTLVNTQLLLALVDTAKRSTDLEGVYDDSRDTFFKWDAIDNLLQGTGETNADL